MTGTASIDQRARIQAAAFRLGFDAFGVAAADEPLGVEHDRYLAFIEAGKHGDMAYLGRHAEVRRRLDTEAILPGARSVVCVAKRYARPAGEDPVAEGAVAPLLAKYARGRDYHGHVRKRLRALADVVRTVGGEGTEARPLCDIEPVMERVWAERAGLGFVGKNGLVIVPGQGSYVLLGEVVTSLALPADTPIGERCGACTRCLDACPTSAFDAAFVLDPRKCVSYLTIEATHPPEGALREGIGDHLFGCDDCQDVCPYNRTAPPDPLQTKDFAPLAPWRTMTLEDVRDMDRETFDRVTPGSPLRRASREGLAENARIVLENREKRRGA